VRLFRAPPDFLRLKARLARQAAQQRGGLGQAASIPPLPLLLFPLALIGMKVSLRLATLRLESERLKQSSKEHPDG